MPEHTKNHGIVVGVDGSAASNAAVCWAAHDAVMRKIPLSLVHVVNPTASTWRRPHCWTDLPNGRKRRVAGSSQTP